MERNKLIEEKLKMINAETGDLIRVARANKRYEGILMPHHAFSQEDIITLKLKNGYNIGIAVDEKTELTLLEKQKTIKKP